MAKLKNNKFVVIEYNNFYHTAKNISGSVEKIKAKQIWNKKTKKGTKNKDALEDIFYMVFPEGRGDHLYKMINWKNKIKI